MKKLSVLFAILFCACASNGQQVQVSAIKGGVALSIEAQKSYQFITGEEKRPALSIECLQKGKKNGHLVIFSPAGEVVQADPLSGIGNGPLALLITLDGTSESTNWVPYRDSSSFAYLGKTEPERVQFMHTLVNAKIVSIEFKPFLTGTLVKVSFDTRSLRDELSKHPECSEQ